MKRCNVKASGREQGSGVVVGGAYVFGFPESEASPFPLTLQTAGARAARAHVVDIAVNMAFRQQNLG